MTGPGSHESGKIPPGFHFFNPSGQEAGGLWGNTVFGESGSNYGSRNEEGATVMNRNPWDVLVGGTGFEPVTSTV